MNPDPASLTLASAGAPRRRVGAGLLRVAGFAALVLVPWLWRALFWPRSRGIADLDDRQLADIGLTRSDVPRRGTGGAAEAETAARLRRGGGW